MLVFVLTVFVVLILFLFILFISCCSFVVLLLFCSSIVLLFCCFVVYPSYYMDLRHSLVDVLHHLVKLAFDDHSFSTLHRPGNDKYQQSITIANNHLFSNFTALFPTTVNLPTFPKDCQAILTIICPATIHKLHSYSNYVHGVELALFKLCATRSSKFNTIKIVEIQNYNTHTHTHAHPWLICLSLSMLPDTLSLSS